MLRNFFIDCSKAANCCDKAQYNEASRIEKLKMRLHRFFCERCQNYTKKNTKLTKLIRKANLKPCPEEEKQQWRKKIENELSKSNSV
ncbi:hypothetical protein [Salegentibacter chungangensis]|uniref:Glycine dehydrogenase n=1 Tax=Salegentibacter chungangensis TaxID=1335724 RepID=A0ABW3NWR3_9FLAO